MKYAFVFIVFVILSTFTYAQWVQQNSGTTALLTCVYFADSLHGWVGTNVDTILRTSNSGENWIKVSTSTNECIKKIFFINKDTGWCACNSEDSHGIICKSIDGGITWNKVYQNNIGPRSIYFSNDTVGWATGYAGFQGGQVICTLDGGKTWRQYLDIGTEIRPYDIFFINKDTGFVAGGESPKIYKTINGGQNWRNIYIEDLPYYDNILSISFADKQNGLISSQAGMLLVTNNEGENWKQIYTGKIGNFYAVVNHKPRYWIAGERTIICSPDSGANWYPQYKHNVSFTGLCFVNDSLGWAVGTSGNYDSLLILKTVNGGFPALVNPVAPKLINPPNNSTNVTNIYFEWEDIQFSAFEIQIALDNLFNNIVKSATIVDPFLFFNNLNNYTVYYWRVRSKYIDGYSIWSNIFKFETSIFSGINNYGNNPNKFNLMQNYPNPFNPITTLKYSLEKAGNVKLTVYNAIGSKVTTVVSEFKNAGNYSINFIAYDLPSGIYFYKLEAGQFTQVKKMMVIK